MGNMIGFFVALVTLLLAIDWYVYVHWRAYAKPRRRIRSSLPWYLIAMSVMPFMLPLYFYFSRWWEVEPKLARALFIGFWTVYYLPKVIIAGFLLIKDVMRGIMWLFSWFQKQLAVAPEVDTSIPSPEPPLDITDMKRLGRREFLTRMGWTASSVPYVVAGYSVFKTLYDFKVHRVDVPISELPRALDGLTIVQLSDLHAGSFFSERPMMEAVDLSLEAHPDLIVITGDYVNNNDRELERIAPALNRLQAPLGVYGCLGNHDHYANTPAVIQRLNESPVDLLVNQHRTLAIDGAQLNIVGTDNTGFNQHYANLPAALAGIPDSQEKLYILLAHDPTFWDKHVRPNFPEIDLMLCGHTHGGQIGLEVGPFRWSLARVSYPRWAGLYNEPRTNGEHDHFLYVNRGLGTVGPPIRFGVRPEITVLTLRRA